MIAAAVERPLNVARMRSSVPSLTAAVKFGVAVSYLR
jgi:hypothetical protein